MKINHIIASMLLAATATVQAATPKYVFYFIGDGMGIAPVMAAETYRRTVLGEQELLLMNRFPVASMAMTYSASSPVTDSAAAGSALATGVKTNNGMIAMSPDTMATTPLSVDFKKKGYGVAVVTNVAPDDATPGVYYAHVPNRHQSYDINRQFIDGPVDFLAGTTLRGAVDKDGKETDIYPLYTQNNIAVARGLDDLKKVDYKKASKVVLLDKHPFENGNIGYTIDSIPGSLTLPEITQAALDYLMETSPKKFFMMVEGGNIDHGLHGNDPKAAILGIIEFNNALDIAYQFMLRHPNETLIVVSADHDTGGLAVGSAQTGYNAYFKYLEGQKISKEMFSRYCRELQKREKYPSWEEMKEYLTENVGLWKNLPLTDEETKQIQLSFYKTFHLNEGKSEKTLYADFNNFAAEIWNLMASKSGVGFIGHSHSGNPVPVYAAGVGADNFKTMNNNTDLPKKIRRIAGLK